MAPSSLLAVPAHPQWVLRLLTCIPLNSFNVNYVLNSEFGYKYPYSYFEKHRKICLRNFGNPHLLYKLHDVNVGKCIPSRKSSELIWRVQRSRIGKSIRVSQTSSTSIVDTFDSNQIFSCFKFNYSLLFQNSC